MLVRLILFSTIPRMAARVWPEVTCRMPASETVCYLTFDDGPTPSTPELLTLLRSYRIPATFFVLGSRAEKHGTLLKQMHEEGHRIGNHGWDHRDPWRLSATAVMASMERTETVIQRFIEEPAPPVRPPYGHLRPSLIRWARTRNRRVYLWDLMPGDFLPHLSPTRMADFILDRIRPGSILVLHDPGACGKHTLLLLTLLLPRMNAAGWHFQPLP